MGRCPIGGSAGGFPRGRQKRGLGAQFQVEIAQEIETFLGQHTLQGVDFEALETAARGQALRVAARALEGWLNADTSDHVGPQLPCSCGQWAQYRGRHEKSFESVLGTLRLERAYYYCEPCQGGFCPRDRTLGLEDFSLSPAVLRMVGSTATLVSFLESSTLLQELAGVQVNPKQVERAAEALGQEIAADERQTVEPVSDGPLPSTLYLGIDGTGIPMRSSELVGRPGKQEDGSAKTREVKLVTVWSAEAKDEEGIPVRDPGSVSYSAAIESAATHDTDPDYAEFTQRVQREAIRRGFPQAPRTAVLGDGAVYIWNIAGELFPQATQIVDRFHVKQHLSDVAKAIYGPDRGQCKLWAHQRYEELDEGRLHPLLEALQLHAPDCEEARKCSDYIKRNQHRMRYAEFHAQGLCTSTGVVEAGCKVAIGTRLKRSGMHWTSRGANAIIALRCCKLSGRFEDFWERRAVRRAA
jgi:hypothetical protein